MATVKNGYVTLNADPTVKEVQPAGVYYNYDENSIYINFKFDDTIDLSDIQQGTVLIKFNSQEKVNDLVLDLNIVLNSNTGFIVLPEEYTSLVGSHYGEVNLRYPNNSLTVGHFNMIIEKSMIETETKKIAEVYVPSFNEIVDMYNEWDKKMQEEGIGTLVEAVNLVKTYNNQTDLLYKALKPMATSENDFLNEGDQIPYGVSHSNSSYFKDFLPSGFGDGEYVTFIRINDYDSGSPVDTYIVINSATGKFWMNSSLGTDSGGYGWMQFNPEITLWENKSGQDLTGGVELKLSADKFSKIKVRARFLGTEAEFFGNKDGVTLTQTNISNTIEEIYFIEGKMKFDDVYHQTAKVEEVRSYRLTDSGLNTNDGVFYITEIVGVL